MRHGLNSPSGWQSMTNRASSSMLIPPHSHARSEPWPEQAVSDMIAEIFLEKIKKDMAEDLKKVLMFVEFVGIWPERHVVETCSCGLVFCLWLRGAPGPARGGERN